MFILFQFLTKTVSDGGCIIENITQLSQIWVFTISIVTNLLKLILAPLHVQKCCHTKQLILILKSQ